MPGQVDRGVGGAAIAVVEDDRPAGEVGARRPGDLDRLAGVGADIVVMDFVDERRAGRDEGVVVDDRAGRLSVGRASAPPVGAERVTVNVSLASLTVSPATWRVIVFEVSLAAKVEVAAERPAR